MKNIPYWRLKILGATVLNLVAWATWRWNYCTREFGLYYEVNMLYKCEEYNSQYQSHFQLQLKQIYWLNLIFN